MNKYNELLISVNDKINELEAISLDKSDEYYNMILKGSANLSNERINSKAFDLYNKKKMLLKPLMIAGTSFTLMGLVGTALLALNESVGVPSNNLIESSYCLTAFGTMMCTGVGCGYISTNNSLKKLHKPKNISDEELDDLTISCLEESKIDEDIELKENQLLDEIEAIDSQIESLKEAKKRIENIIIRRTDRIIGEEFEIAMNLSFENDEEIKREVLQLKM